jgi:hypothetical protein
MCGSLGSNRFDQARVIILDVSDPRALSVVRTSPCRRALMVLFIGTGRRVRCRASYG